ncbi:MAG TPA: DUF4062 domain-containing protein [Thauera sp.]|nr:DUF4062 domain-containing protein [Thauera sp.]
MAKIYLSSTYKDLAEARAAVYRVLRKMGHDVIAMEDYVSSDQRPLDQCLADVAACDVYIGLFAWSCGYIPPNQERSITELEFRQAERCSKPCLIFLLHEDAPWSRKLMDRGIERIESLRADLCRDRVVSFFQTTDELAAAVSVAVARLESEVLKVAPSDRSDGDSLVDLVGKMVGECIRLVEQRRHSDQRLYEDFVGPALNDFEKVHQNYLECFQRYRSMVDDATMPLNKDHPVLKKIGEDMLFWAQLRLKLESLQDFRKDPLFGAFITKIIEYTRGSEFTRNALLNGARPLLNAARSCAFVGLSGIFGDKRPTATKRTDALSLLDRVVGDLQVTYGQVLREHMALKKRLLDHREG